MSTVAEIWDGDLFGREAEAQLLIAYIESLVDRPFLREDKKAYTIAIDAPYGFGKSYFLRRLADNIGINHPVAFVDAWADDLADEPLTALVATLHNALSPVIGNPAVQTHLKSFVQKAGSVAKYAAIGALRRGASLAITATAVTAIESILIGNSELQQEALADQASESGADIVESAEKAIALVNSGTLMDKRIAQFEEGKAAIAAMKASLRCIVASLADGGKAAPIVVVIDELDRCRPTYAVKLLEEIKHLFDVPGLVFILAMHGRQLAHSVSGAYGPNFDGRSYLGRFIDREYALAEPDLEPLLIQLCAASGLQTHMFEWSRLGLKDSAANQVSLPRFLAIYMQAYGHTARDAFNVVDLLQTCNAVAKSGGHNLQLNYLVPLIFGHLQGLELGELPATKNATLQNVVWFNDRYGNDKRFMGFQEVAILYQSASKMDNATLSKMANDDMATPAITSTNLTRAYGTSKPPLWAIDGYGKLVKTVSRLTSPATGQATSK